MTVQMVTVLQGHTPIVNHKNDDTLFQTLHLQVEAGHHYQRNIISPKEIPQGENQSLILKVGQGHQLSTIQTGANMIMIV